MLRLQRYNLRVEYQKGSSLVLADTLSRAPLPVLNAATPSNFDVFHLSVQQVDQQPNLHLTSLTTIAMQRATASDPVMQSLLQTIIKGWPPVKSSLPSSLSPYWPFRDELSASDGIIYRSSQAVVPPSSAAPCCRRFTLLTWAPTVTIACAETSYSGRECVQPSTTSAVTAESVLNMAVSTLRSPCSLSQSRSTPGSWLARTYFNSTLATS